MWYDPVAFGLGKRDVIGAWIVCLAVAAACFGGLAAAPNGSATPAGLIGPDPPGRVAAAEAHPQGRC